MLFHIYGFFVNKAYALVFQKLFLNSGAAEGKARSNSPVAVYNSVAGDNSGSGVVMQSIAHNSCPTGIACKESHLPIGCNLAFRNGFYNLINLFKGRNGYPLLSKYCFITPVQSV